jgi:hypothetical protein
MPGNLITLIRIDGLISNRGPDVSGGPGREDPRGRGPLRRWLGGVDRGIDDELNRFFSPTDRSRTGEVVDKYAQRVEASLQRATERAKKTKVDLDTLGDEYVDRLLGKRKKRASQAGPRPSSLSPSSSGQPSCTPR